MFRFDLDIQVEVLIRKAVGDSEYNVGAYIFKTRVIELDVDAVYGHRQAGTVCRYAYYHATLSNRDVVEGTYVNSDQTRGRARQRAKSAISVCSFIGKSVPLKPMSASQPPTRTACAPSILCLPSRTTTGRLSPSYLQSLSPQPKPACVYPGPPCVHP